MYLSDVMKTKLAGYISTIGHPLLTISVFAIIAFFYHEPVRRAFFHSLLIIGGIAVPLLVKMYRGTQKGTYTNFDISNKGERQSWYIFPITILAIITALLYLTHQSRAFCLTLLLSLNLLIVSQVVNHFIKSSLHVSFNIFLSFLILFQHAVTGLVFLVFTVLIGWSRLVLKRHSLMEIVAGAAIGLTIGLLAFFML